MLSSGDREVMQEIIDAEGRCLSFKRCIRCPFSDICLPSLISGSALEPNQRLNMSMNILMHHDLIDDDLGIESLKIEFGKPKL